MTELTEYASTTEAMFENPKPVPGGGRPWRLTKAAGEMIQYHPHLSAAYYDNAARLGFVDAIMVVRFSAVRKAYEAAESFFAKLEEADRLSRTTGNTTFDDATLRKMLTSAGALSRTAATEARDAALDLEWLFWRRSWLRRLALRFKWYQRRRIEAFRQERARKKADAQRQR